ncbi:MAG: response regulator transcription factor [Candidatus Gracilibacteria bacterium]|jgi:DNA-binding response OmpR family regulator|nr:response regulator transcription factor [Candidatus Gracilibacteria bacterium]
MRILIADDEELILDFMAKLLEEKRFLVRKANTFQDTENALLEGEFDLIILDRNFASEKRDGIELCKKIRQDDKNVPILMLSGIKGSRERSNALNLGADDYLEKPYDPVELIARAQALLRRRDKLIPEKVEDFECDLEKEQILLDGLPLDLKIKEFQLLYHFLNNPNRIVKEKELLEKVWNDDNLITKSNTINVHIMRLRKAIGRYAPKLKTVRGQGFIFEI